MHSYEVLRRPVVTEKSTALSAQRKYVFEVALGANKPQIKEAIEVAFDVTVEAVNTTIVRGARKKNRAGRTTGEAPRWKKAIVTLAPGSAIEFFEGV
ncbi:MAG: 50S ribosomal protein L23 [Chloroflexi bacterium]|nr:50S ribosomal protein L23 [Chloroflexota bacterium]MQC17251.1 50S ribosomal protein L23 [Chloroflexota bacterium]